MSLQDLIPILQVSIGPVILISGVGLLLLTMTNRYARIIDRSRLLAHDLRSSDCPEGDQLRILAQLRVLSRRAGIVRWAIGLAGLCVLLVAFLVILLFLISLFRLNFVWVIIALFTTSLMSLIASLICFMVDINISLAALEVVVGDVPRI